MTTERTEIRPQKGPQESVLSSPADIVFTGGAAGGGKTWSILLDPLRHIHRPHFGPIFFRRTYAQIEQEDGLWDQASRLYPMFGAKSSGHVWTFPQGMRIRMSHLQHEKHVTDHQGAGYPALYFDEITHFTPYQFWYMFSRLRSTSGVRPYMRATCNPDPDSFVAELVAWWIDQETGYALPERSGVIRWFVRVNEELIWGPTRHDAIEAALLKFPDAERGDLLPKSFTFIPSKLSDNPALTRKDPGYRANLLLLTKVERERLLGGNWKIRPSAGNVFDRSWFQLLRARPAGGVWVRYWDKAGTEGGTGARSAGVLIGRVEEKGTGKRFVVADVIKGRWSAGAREAVIKQTADADKIMFGTNVTTWVEQEPGSGGKESAENTVRNLAGHKIYQEVVRGDKTSRAGPLSAQAEAHNVFYVDAEWNEEWLREMHAFPEGKLKDQVDASSGAFNKVVIAPAAHDPNKWATVKG